MKQVNVKDPLPLAKEQVLQLNGLRIQVLVIFQLGLPPFIDKNKLLFLNSGSPKFFALQDSYFKFNSFYNGPYILQLTYPVAAFFCSNGRLDHYLLLQFFISFIYIHSNLFIFHLIFIFKFNFIFRFNFIFKFIFRIKFLIRFFFFFGMFHSHFK